MPEKYSPKVKFQIVKEVLSNAEDFTITGGDSGSFRTALRGRAFTPEDTEPDGTDIT